MSRFLALLGDLKFLTCLYGYLVTGTSDPESEDPLEEDEDDDFLFDFFGVLSSFAECFISLTLSLLEVYYFLTSSFLADFLISLSSSSSAFST